ncbi:MAG: putative hydroxymethylpyrimidine transporter CytX [Lactobacillus sp.]|jgi:putative hydroxymethylpyrimidine transporter CytX|nr:putative hydroxymethylpyrimidine transporter CytX [Lactobacillus sp.]
MKTSVRDNALLWFGAAISLAEILSGTLFAPLGLAKGMLAVVLGHLIGGALMFGCGVIGARTGQAAMATTALTFGRNGSRWFAGLNVLQLLGWTAVMVLTGAQACQVFLPVSLGFWAAVIGAITVLWLAVGLRDLGRLNQVAMLALLIAGVYLTARFLMHPAQPLNKGSLQFGAALELAIAMPLSWLPLIADYTSQAKNPQRANLVSVGVYNVTSIWMFAIGLFGAVLTGQTAIAGLMKGFGLGVVALIVIILSTITTTFLDVYSAGVSAALLFGWSRRWLAIAITVIGTVVAVFVPENAYADFLYWISAVFVPLAVVQIVAFFLGQRARGRWDWPNLGLWVIGVGCYRVFLAHGTPLGSTIPVVVIVALLTLVVNWRRRTANENVE